MNKVIKASVVCLILLTMAGCGAGNGFNGNKAQINQLNTNKIGEDRPVRVSSKAARSVERLAEVQSAHVIIDNQSAYVAIRLNDAQSLRAQGYRTNKEDTGNKNAGTFGNPGYQGYGYGTQTGEYSGTGIGGGSIEGLALEDTGQSQKSFGAGNGANPGTTSNPKIITDSSTHGVSNSLIERIANLVASADPTIQRVYLSFNHEFYMRMNRFVDDVNNVQSGIGSDVRKAVKDLFGKQ
ncbi:YhcN/YlaJ family sporulation lipoprotein [Bacillus sp. B-jedd]|uniref:YhcN/YlaJ family sporulation lipoprotein n=1 Tax=Bacillus sp. B-jedd TaxID=1476857 RepID=UPI0005156A2E|nr:YhcN/YlaJ family sporulation lipoprotein [Bacillus sp. B-jedd]CEG26459.1 Sporulation lipoprotein YhcN/YlaJ (Spore_YhcN_YlaJ) [Bacillus sp. B-jedd]